MIDTQLVALGVCTRCGRASMTQIYRSSPPPPSGMVAVIDTQLVALSRAWCLYEMWTCIHDADLTKLKVCFPGGWQSWGG